MVAISIRGDLRPLQKAFTDLRAKQVPFATSLALNSLAQGVRAAERADIIETFKSPTPFTQNAYAITPAKKDSLIASVFAKDVQATYLEPYVDGGMRSLGTKQAMIVPIAAGVNQYGNLPKGRLQALKGKQNVFIGKIKSGKSGHATGGVWQRPTGTGKRRQPLKLLILFEPTTPAPKHLDFYLRAQKFIHANAAAAFDAGMQKALATARR